MNLTVVIPSRNVDNLRPCVEAVRKNEPVARIVVVDDSPGTVTDIARLCAELDLDWFRGVKPFVFARNCNIGIRAAGDNDVILLNDDALLESPGGFTAMQALAARHGDYGIFGATTNLTGQPMQQRMNGPGSGLREVPHIAFVCVLIPRRTREFLADTLLSRDSEGLWRSDGLLDERYCLDYGVEDRDYCEQVRACGLKVGVYDGCYVDHSKLHSSFRGDPKAPASFAKNYELFKQKWGVK